MSEAHALGLDESCRLLAGADSWRTRPLPVEGSPVLKLSDGPNGIRGEGQGDDRTPAVAIPVAIAIGASFDPALAGELGDLLGREARRKGAHAVLGPGLNLHRTPIGGRTFEYFSEDAELTARLGTALVRGIQGHRVAAVVKHLVANDTEVERLTVDVDVDEATLREYYLRPFHRAVVEGGAWAVMAAYNQLAGSHCAEHPWLLRDLLRTEWGFDGVVVSDWFGAHDTVLAARAGLTLEMPGPPRVFGRALADAVRAGTVDEGQVRARVDELGRLARRTRAAHHVPAAERSVDDPEERHLCRRAAHAGIVLLRNRGVLPLGDAARVAVLGPTAASTPIMGGGSSALRPLAHRSILESLRAEPWDLVHEPGVCIDRFTRLPTRCHTPDGQPGLEVRYYNRGDRDPVHVGQVDGPALRQLGSAPAGVDPTGYRIQVVGTITPQVDGRHDVGAVVTGPAHVTLDGHDIINDPEGRLPRGATFYGFGTDEIRHELVLSAGCPVPVTIDVEVTNGFGAVRLGLTPPPDPDAFDRAVTVASDADVAIVVVGTTDEWEAEGFDRADLRLPGRQDELVRAVTAVNDRTIVVATVGSPTAMPWADDVGATLVAFYGGVEAGPALVDVLTGRADPAGRLPTTFPGEWGSWPVAADYAPVDGRQVYRERDRFGYRAWPGTGVQPAFYFGEGLTYGAPQLRDVAVDTTSPSAGQPLVVTAEVVNVGEHDGTCVLQAYLDESPPAGLRRLCGFGKAAVPAGGRATVTVEVRPDAFDRWVPGTGWERRSGQHRLLLATSSRPGDHVAAWTITIT